MKKLTFVAKAYGSMMVDNDCPNDPGLALDYINSKDMWDDIQWGDMGDLEPDTLNETAAVCFIDGENGETFYE